MKLRWISVKTIVTVSTTTPNDAARPKSEGYCTNENISVGMNLMPRGEPSASGTSNSPAEVTNTINAADSNAGSTRGMVICRNVYQNDAP